MYIDVINISFQQRSYSKVVAFVIIKLIDTLLINTMWSKMNESYLVALFVLGH